METDLDSDVGSTLIEGKRRAAFATVQVARFDLINPTEAVFPEQDEIYLDLCLTPRCRNSRACYIDRWGPHRFERIGELFVIPSGERLLVRGDGGRQASVVCELRPLAVRRWFEDDFHWNEQRLEASLDIASASLRSLMLRLAAEVQHPGFAAEAMIELITAQIAIELGRYRLAADERAAGGGLSPWRLKLIDERIDEMRRAPTLAELARLCDLSVRQLTRGFRASRGSSIGDYLALRRIDNAKAFLGRGESVKAIAHSMGFASPSSFSYAFRRATGTTPRQFREHIRRG